MEPIKVTIAIPNYNYGRYIAETIESVLSQDFPYHELLIYDDCSTDNSLEVIGEYSKSVNLVRGVKNIGLGASRNVLIEKASGTHILFLDSDDLLCEGALRALVERAKGSDVVFGKVTSFSDFKTSYKRHENLNKTLLKFIEDGNVHTLSQIVTACNKLISLDFIKYNNILFSEYRFMEDALFAQSLAFSNPRCCYVDKYILKIRHHQASLSNIDSSDKIELLLNVTAELVEKNRKNALFTRLRLDGNSLVYFMINNKTNVEIIETIRDEKQRLSYGTRLLVFLKLLYLTRSRICLSVL